MATARSLQLFVLMDTEDAVSALESLADKSKATADEITESGVKSGGAFGDGINRGTEQAGTGLEALTEKARASGDAMQETGVKTGSVIGDGIDKGTTQAGIGIEALSAKMADLGFAGAGAVGAIGKELKATDTEAAGLTGTLSGIGKTVVVGGLVAFGAAAYEGVKQADKLATAQAALKTAVINSGNSWSAYESQISAAEAAGAKFGASDADVAGGLQILATATNSPVKALNDLTLAENISIMKHESVTEAAQQLAKVMGGNVRILASWGINLDIASGKLHSIQSAEEAVQNANLALNAAQAEVSSGQETGARGSALLAAAELKVHDANLNLSESQHAISDILATLNQRTKDAGKIYGDTLPGEIAIAKAEVDDLAAKFGNFLIPKLVLAGHALEDVIGWFDKNKDAAMAAAAVIGGVLATAVSVFAYQKAVAFYKATETMVTGLVNLGKTVVQKAALMIASSQTEETVVTQANATIESSNSAVQLSFGTMTGEIQGSLAELDASVAGFGTTVSTADDTIITSNEAAGASFLGMLGPIALVAAALYGIDKLGVPTAKAAATVAAQAPGGHQLSGVAGGGRFTIAGPYAGTPGETNAQVIAAQKQRAAEEAAAKLGVKGAEADAANKKVTAAHIAEDAAIQAGIIAEKGLTGAALTVAKDQVIYDKALRDGASALTLAKDQAAITVASAKAARTPGSTIPGLAKTPGISTAGGTPSTALTQGEINLFNQAKAANEALMLAMTKTTGGSLDKLVADLTKVHQQGFQNLITALNATANTRLTSLATQLETTLATAIEKLGEVQTLAVYKRADTVATEAARTTATTTAAQATGQAAVTISGLGGTQTANLLNQAATAIQNAATLQHDAAQAQLVAAQDQEQAAADTSSAIVSSIQDQTQIQVDTLAERGLYGLALQAQMAQVVLDQQKASDDAAIAAAQQHLDAVTTQENALTAAAQANADSVTQKEAQLTATAQSKYDSIAIINQQAIATAQAHANAVNIQGAIAEAAAQAHVDAMQFGTQQQQQMAQAAQRLATATWDSAEANANSTLTAVTNSSNLSTQNAQNAYNQAAAAAALAEANAQAALTAANDTSAQTINTAQNQLQTLQEYAAISEAKDQAQVNYLQELANVQYAGSGIQIVITSLAASDEAAITAAASYLYRYKAS